MKIDVWGNDLQHLLKQLRLIKRLRLIIIAQNRILKEAVPLVRTLIFGGMATFTELVQLSFLGIQFSYQASINDFVAMEQILSTIFKNNSIHHLKLYKDWNFPFLPKIKTFKQKNSNFIGKIITNDSSLKSMKCYKVMSSNWDIDEFLFNQLQVLILWPEQLLGTLKVNNHQIQGTLAQVTFIIRLLRVLVHCNFCFPNQQNQLFWSLKMSTFRPNLFVPFPLPILRSCISLITILLQTKVQSSQIQTGLFLENMTLSSCGSINEKAWSDCQFKGLIRLKIDSRMLGKGKKALSIVKNKGIKAFY